MGGDVGGFADIGGITDFAADIGSVTTDFGTEYMSAFNVTDFQVPGVDIAGAGGFDIAGSFAGSANWFDTFNSGSILSSIPSVSDFNLGSITGGLPSLSSIAGGANPIGGALSSLGISPSITSTITRALGGANPISATTSGLNIPGLSTVTRGLSGANPISAATAGLGLPTAAGTGLISKSAVSVPEGTVFRELNATESAQLTKNAPLINSFTDPQANNVTNYDQAQTSKAEIEASIQEYQTAIAGYEREISNANLNIQEMQANLQDPDLSQRQRALLQTQIANNQAAIAQNTDLLFEAQQTLDSLNQQLADDQQIIDQTNDTATNSPAPVDPTTLEGFGVPETPSIGNANTAPTPVDPTTLEGFGVPASTTTTITGAVFNPTTQTNTDAQALVSQARTQQSIRSLRTTAAQSTDWRVRLRLAPQATYLYKDDNNQLLAPLRDTDGVIFPYTPSIETAYKAIYNPYDLTHSNYRGYFYQGSYVDTISVRGTFTAQDTKEANYLLATIQFFRSVTKMFYGQDAQHGTPPPMVYLSGFGDYQFQEHPCVVSQFNYTLPPDVDYIRAGSAVDNGTNFLNNRTRTTIASNPLSYAINRLLNNRLTQGAQDNRPQANGNKPPVDVPTYVPTKIEIALTLLPMQSRQQISTQFSLQAFSNGNLLKGGFW